MDLRLIRNATLRVRYGGINLLIDPMLGTRNSIRSLGDVPRRNPTIDLPCTVDEVLADVDAVLVSHMHPDHFDDAACGVVPRHLPVFCCPGDDDTLTDAGFEHVVALSEPTTWRGIQITPTAGSHGSGPIGERMGHVIGVVLRADDEPTVYWAGDTILTPAVLDTIEREQPDLIITHSSGGAANGTKIIMDAADRRRTHRSADPAPGAARRVRPHHQRLHGARSVDRERSGTAAARRRSQRAPGLVVSRRGAERRRHRLSAWRGPQALAPAQHRDR